MPLSHRLSILYLTMPVVVWLVGWFEWWVGVPLAVLLTAGLWKGGWISGSWRMSLPLPVLCSLLAALAWLLLIPLSGLWLFNDDSETLFTLSLEISRGGWPSYLTDHLNDSSLLLSYYIGLLTVPGLIGRWLGPAALSWAIPLYILLGVGLLVAVFTRGLTTLRSTLVAIVILVFFSGMGALEVLLTMGLSDAFEIMFVRTGDVYSIMESTISSPTTGRLYLFFQANSATLWFSPQHLIASGLVSLIIIQSRHLRFAAVAGLVLAVCVFWSAGSAVGLLPLIVSLVVQKGVRPFLTWSNLLVAPLLASLIVFYLLNSDRPGGYGWLWQHYATHSQMLMDLLRFYLTEFALLAFLLWRIDHKIIKDPMFVASLVALSACPLFVYNIEVLSGGLGKLSDIHMMNRIAVPALVALTYFASRAITGCLPEAVGRANAVISPTPSSFRRLHTSLIAVLAVGALVPLSIFLKSTNHPQSGYEQVGRTILTHSPPLYAMERSIATVPRWLQILLRDRDLKEYLGGRPIISSKYEVYFNRQDNMLIYLNHNCTPRSEQNTRFFLHIYPVDSSDLSLNRKQAGYEIKDSRWDSYTQRTDACIATFSLPDYNIDRIATGQYTPYLGVEWAAEYRFRQPDQTIATHIQSYNPSDFYNSYQQLAAIERPIIRSIFNIHWIRLHRDTLIYVKNDCTRHDTRTPFFLHIIPTDGSDLPAYRRQLGFDNHDFLFNERGVIIDDECLAVIPLPDYDIAAIRTGQFNPADGSRLWQEEAAQNT